MADFNDESLTRLMSMMDAMSDRYDQQGELLQEVILSEEELKKRRKKIQDEVEAETRKRIEAIAAATSKITAGAVQFTSGLSTQEGSFKAMGDVTASVVKGLTSLVSGIPLVGGIIKGLGEGAAEAIKLITSESSKAFGVFSKVSGSGIVASFDDLRTATKKTGLLYEEVDAVLTKNSEAMAIFGGTTLNGSKTFQEILSLNKDAALNAQKMGIGFAEFSEMQASYVSQQIKSGFARGKTDAQLAEGAKKYSEELDILSKLTGKQRSEIQKEQEKLLSDARYQAAMANLASQGPDGEKRAEEIKKLMSLAPASMQEGIKDIIASGGSITSKAAAEVALQLSQGGMDVQKMFGGLTTGATTASQVMTDMANAAKVYTDQTSHLTSIIGPGSPLTVNFADLAILGKRAGQSFEQMEEERKKEIKKQQETTDKMAEAMNKSHELAFKVQSMILDNADIVMAANTFMADALIGLAELIEKITGKSSGAKPEGGIMSSVKQYLPAAMTVLGGVAGAALLGAGTYGIGAGYGAAVGGAAGAALGLKIADMLPGEKATSAGGSGKKLDDLFIFGSGSGAKSNFEQLTPSLQQRVIAAAEEYNAATGKKLTINSAWRDPADQKRLWEQGKPDPKDPNKRVGPSDMPIAPPGKSLHEQGRAIDIQEYNDPVAIAAMNKQGLRQTVPNDPVHFAMIPGAAKGAIVTPTPGGTLYQIGEGGQSEAIIPMPDGRSIPVTFKNSNEQNNILVSAFETMADKLDTMIDLLNKGNKIQNTIVRNTA